MRIEVNWAVLIAAYVLSTAVGHFLVSNILDWIKKRVGQKPKSKALDGFIGCTERFVVTTLVIWTPIYVAPFIGGWVALKMAANWQSIKDRTESVRQGSLIALLGNVYSFAIAIGAGLIVRPDAWQAWTK